MSLTYTPTPVQEISSEILSKAEVRLLVKREDLNHAEVSGNKWWKLKYNLVEAKESNKKVLLTFGGAYSNHIYATAAAANLCGFESIGIIRGEKILPLNTTLAFAEEKGMKLHFISREAYRQKDEAAFIDDLKTTFGDFYLIPEGGTNNLAVKACAEFASTHLSEVDYDYLCLPVGTAGTISGIICGLNDSKKIIGFPVLKGAEFLIEDISNLIQHYAHRDFINWSLITAYHHGGYAKTTPALLNFIDTMKSEHNLPLDHVYTAKLFRGILKEVQNGTFKKGSTILAIHTGGLQGNYGLQ